MGRCQRHLLKRVSPLTLAVLLGLCPNVDGGGRAAARLTDVVIEFEGGSTRIVIETTGAPRYRAAWLEEGNRLIVDFDDTQYAWTESSLDVDAEPVKRVRGAQFQRETARIVIELTHRASYEIEQTPHGLSVMIPVSPETVALGTASGGAANGGVAARAPAATLQKDGAATPALRGSTSAPPAPVDGQRLATPVALPTSAVATADTQLLRETRGTFDFDRLKRSLAQVTTEPKAAETPAPTPAPSGETIDLSMQQAIDLAFEKNLGVQVARLAKESAWREIDKAGAAFHPTVGYALSASRQQPVIAGVTQPAFNSQSVQPFIRQTFPTSTSLVLSGDLTRNETEGSSSTRQVDSTVAISLIQPLLRGGRTYVATQPLRNAEFDYRVSGERLKAEILQVKAQAKSAYYGVLLAEKVIEATEAALDRDKTLIEASQALFKARLVTKRDVFSAELIFAQDSARLVSARADLENARNGLLNVLGLPIGAGVKLLDREVTFEPVTVELDRWIERGIKNRPEVLALEQELEKNLLGIEVAKNGILPQLDLVGSYGRTENGPRFGSSLLDFRGEVWTASLVFSIPIGNVAARAALAQAELERSSLLRTLQQTRRQVELDVRAAAIKLQKSVERMKALTVAIDQAKGKLEVGRAQFALGQATNLDITDAQQSLLSAETDLLTAIVDYKTGLAELEAAVGDGAEIKF